jgi:hypothetical protein
LYQGGINRELFTPLIDLLKIKCNVMEIGGGKDYRSEHPEYVDGLWVVRSEEGGKDGRGGLERTFHELSGVPLTAAEPDEVQVVMGRCGYLPPWDLIECMSIKYLTVKCRGCVRFIVPRPLDPNLKPRTSNIKP